MGARVITAIGVLVGSRITVGTVILGVGVAVAVCVGVFDGVGVMVAVGEDVWVPEGVVDGVCVKRVGVEDPSGVGDGSIADVGDCVESIGVWLAEGESPSPVCVSSVDRGIDVVSGGRKMPSGSAGPVDVASPNFGKISSSTSTPAAAIGALKSV